MPEQVENHMVVDSYWNPIHKPVKQCDSCEGGLFEGDEYYDIDGCCICHNCISDYIKKNYRRLI